MSTTIANPIRIRKADFSVAWIFGPYSTLLPYPKEAVNFAATFEPLSYEVRAITIA